jgi:small subunit ribosomal protein S4e
MSKHMKRMSAPRAMRVARKNFYWVSKPNPGAHPLSRSVSAVVLLRDHLGLVSTSREAAAILSAGDVHVDGRAISDGKFAIGLMDVVSIAKTKSHYRLMLDGHGRLTPVKISAEEAKWKLARVENSRTLPGGIRQYNLHDGRNIQTTKAKYKPGDTLQIEVPSQKVVATFEFKEGATALIISGTHTGQLAKVGALEVVRSSRPNIVKFQEGISTIRPNVFVVGRDRAEVQTVETAVVA